MSSADDNDKPRVRGVVAVVAPLTALAILAAGGWWVWKAVVAEPEHTASHTNTYDEEISRVNLDAAGRGDVVLRVGEVDEIVVAAEHAWNGSTQPESVEQVSGGVLEIEVDGCGGFNFLGLQHCEVAYEITVPADTEIDVNNNSGTVDSEGVAGDQVLKTRSGDVDVRDAGGDVQAAASSGDVTAAAVSGDLDVEARSGAIRTQDVAGSQALNASSGDIEVADAGGDVDLQARSGDITAEGLDAASASAEASSGNVTLSFDSAPTTVEAQARSGNVTVRLPDDGDAYDVHTSARSGDETVAVETSEGADHEVEATASSGDVTVEYR